MIIHGENKFLVAGGLERDALSLRGAFDDSRTYAWKKGRCQSWETLDMLTVVIAETKKNCKAKKSDVAQLD